MKKKNVALVVAGLALLVGFFLDWVGKRSGLDLVLHGTIGWSRYLFLLVPVAGALIAGFGILDHKVRAGVAILGGLAALGLTIFLWTKSLPTDRIEFWIVVGAAVGSIYLIATRAKTELLAIPGLALVGAYFVPTITVAFPLMVVGAVLAIAGLTKHRTAEGLALALPLVIIAPMVQRTALIFRYQAKLGMWLVVGAALAAIVLGIAMATRRSESTSAS